MFSDWLSPGMGREAEVEGSGPFGSRRSHELLEREHIIAAGPNEHRGGGN